LFSQQGYQNVTLRAIAEELGYAHAALYRYFPNKSSLLEEICRNTFSRLLAEIEEIEQQSRSASDALFAVSRGFVRLCVRHPHHFRTVFLGPEIWGEVRAGDYIDTIGRPFFDRLVQVFLRSYEAAGIQSANSILDAHTWWISFFGTAQVLIVSGNVQSLSDGEQIAERQIQVLWRGLTASDA
jgi:AcrR family transcriptional regulator